MPLRPGALGGLFAPAYIPGDPGSAAAIANWQAGRAGMWPSSQVNQYQVAMPRTGNTAGAPTSATTVDPALLQAWAQNQPYTPGPNVSVVKPGALPPAATVDANRNAITQSLIDTTVPGTFNFQQASTQAGGF